MNDKLEKEIYTCSTCGKISSQVGHLCNPLTLEEAYTCADCGQMASDPRHVCKPKAAKLDYICENCGRLAVDKDHLCNPRSLSWSPQIDIYETDEHFVVMADLPGVSKEELNLEIAGDTLEIKGNRKNRLDKGSYHMTERFVGPFERSLILPDGVESGRIDASFNNGILEITIPKSSDFKPKRAKIAIN